MGGLGSKNDLMSKGGCTVNHLLDGVDYRMMGKTPKIFTGVSDGTTLLNTIFAKRVLQHIIAQIPCGCLVEKLEPFRGDFVKTLFNGDVGQLLKRGVAD